MSTLKNKQTATATMDGACMVPEQEKSNKRRHIPLEIVEEILLHLPIKSLFRFSYVSKSWRSIIFGPGFVKRRAALHGRERMVISPHWCGLLVDASMFFGPQRCGDLVDVSSCPLSSISSDKPIEDIATPIICPIQGKPCLRASCDELWCVEVENTLYLWNPSINTYRKLPNPSLPQETIISDFIFGLGYDSVGDDYKILRLPHQNYSVFYLNYPQKSELYSLRSDSWKKIDQPFPEISIPSEKGVFVSGALYWMTPGLVLISFDLSAEKYGEVAPPRYCSPLTNYATVMLTVLRRKLCVFVNYYFKKFVLWVMDEYEIGKSSWTKKFDIDVNILNGIPPDFPKPIILTPPDIDIRKRAFGGRSKTPIILTPLYLYDNNEILFRVSTSEEKSKIFLYKGEDTTPWKIISREIKDGFVYVESLFSPATQPMSGAPVVGNNK